MPLVFLAGLDLFQQVWLCGFYQSLFEKKRARAKHRRHISSPDFQILQLEADDHGVHHKGTNCTEKEKGIQKCLIIQLRSPP